VLEAATNSVSVGFIEREKQVRTLMPDITSSQVSQDQHTALPPEEDPGSVQAIITRGWNAYLLQVVLMKDGETRMLVGKEVVSYAVAETVARVFAATHGISCEKVEVVSK
jgi:hypothetical protein